MGLNGVAPVVLREVRRAQRLRRWAGVEIGLSLGTLAWGLAAVYCALDGQTRPAIAFVWAAVGCDALRLVLVPCRHCGRRGRHALTCSGRRP